MRNLLIVMVILPVILATTNALNVGHFLLDSNTLTWSSARDYCNERGMDLCTHQQICSTGQPIITEASGDDSWVPVLDQEDDWTQIGDNRKCWSHMEHYGKTTWGTLTGTCSPWNTPEDPCPHKKHVLCCDGIQVDNQLTTWDSSRAYCQRKGYDLCRANQICQNERPNMVGELDGKHMTAIRDKYNNWLSIGNSGSCEQSQSHAWGTNIDGYIGGSSTVKTRILCCNSTNPPPVILRPDTFHFYLKSSSLTWTKAKEFCENIPGLQMCSKAEICPDDLPVLTHPIPGDHWAPIRDRPIPTDFNNWVEIGLDNNWTGSRVCLTHDTYGATTWGDITGTCPPWSNVLNDCPHKGNVFCCKI